MARPQIQLLPNPRFGTSRRTVVPRHVAPMLASLSELPAHTQNYAFEYKWDGVRAICHTAASGLTLFSRNLLDITRRYPELQALCHSVGPGAVLDGEIVALDDGARPSFARLQRRMHLSAAAQVAHAVRDVPIVFFIFDVLVLGHASLMGRPYVQRRRVLEQLELAGANWETTPMVLGEGRAMLESARRLGLEGIVAKWLDSIYEPGRRSTAWLKIKLVHRQEFVVGGWAPESGNDRRIGALLVGYYAARSGKGVLRYAGRVGSGLMAEQVQKDLLPLLARLRRGASPFADPVPRADARFVDPTLVVEVEFRGWTDGKALRQPAFKGFRTDKRARDVVLEQ